MDDLFFPSLSFFFFMYTPFVITFQSFFSPPFPGRNNLNQNFAPRLFSFPSLSLSLLFIANNKRRDVFIFTKGAKKKTQLLKNKSANDFSIASKKKKKKKKQNDFPCSGRERSKHKKKRNTTDRQNAKIYGHGG